MKPNWYHDKAPLGHLIASSTGLLMPIESGGSAQGSLLAWDTTAPASLRDTSRAWNCLLTDVVGILLKNTTPADAINTVQYSPVLEMAGTARKTNTTAESQTQGWGMQVRPVSGAAATTSALHFLWRNNGGSLASKGNIDSDGALNTTKISISSGGIIIASYNPSFGLGNCQGIVASGSGSPAILSQKGRNDEANALITGIIYDRGNTVTNDTTMMNPGEGWVNASDVTTIHSHRTPCGDVKSCGRINGQRLDIKSITELTTIAASAYTDTTIQIPANCIHIGTASRITVQPTGTTATDIGNSGTADAYGDDISTVAGVTNTKHVLAVNSSALSIRYTPNTTPSDNAGRIRTTIYYMQITAASS